MRSGAFAWTSSNGLPIGSRFCRVQRARFGGDVHETVPHHRGAVARFDRDRPSCAGFGTTVANHTSLEPDKVTRAVDSLVRLGLVNRRSDRRDRRFVVLTLSTKGKRVNDEIEMVRNAMELELVGVQCDIV